MSGRAAPAKTGQLFHPLISMLSHVGMLDHDDVFSCLTPLVSRVQLEVSRPAHERIEGVLWLLVKPNPRLSLILCLRSSHFFRVHRAVSASFSNAPELEISAGSLSPHLSSPRLELPCKWTWLYLHRPFTFSHLSLVALNLGNRSRVGVWLQNGFFHPIPSSPNIERQYLLWCLHVSMRSCLYHGSSSFANSDGFDGVRCF